MGRLREIIMLIKQDFYFNSIGADRPLHIRIPDHGWLKGIEARGEADWEKQLGIFMPFLWQE